MNKNIIKLAKKDIAILDKMEGLYNCTDFSGCFASDMLREIKDQREYLRGLINEH